LKSSTALLIMAGAICLLLDWTNSLLTLIGMALVTASEEPFERHGRRMRIAGGLLMMADLTASILGRPLPLTVVEI
jgi:hypothetical protein